MTFVPLYYFMYSILAVFKMSFIMWLVFFVHAYASVCVCFLFLILKVCEFFPYYLILLLSLLLLWTISIHFLPCSVKKKIAYFFPPSPFL